MEEVKKHPLWMEVAEMIAEEAKEKGYGLFYSHEKLKELLDIPKAQSIEEYEKAQFKYLNDVEELRNELLASNNLYLDNKRGEGYIVLHPDDQIKYGTDKQLVRARSLVHKAGKILLFVEKSLLSEDVTRLRLEKMKRVAFLRGSFRKKLPAIIAQANEVKKLKNGKS